MIEPMECEFEADALAAALQSRWPDRLDPELHDHILHCAICSDVVAIAGAVDTAREEARALGVLPDSGRVWRMAQIRAHSDAAQAAGRPITAAQLIAFSCAVGLLGACFGAMSTWFQSALSWTLSSVSGLDAGGLLHFAGALFTEHAVLALAMAVMICGVPTAVYFVLSRD